MTRAEARAYFGKSSVGTSLRNPFVTEREREKRETKELYDSVFSLYKSSPFSTLEDAPQWYLDIVTAACDCIEVTPSDELGGAMYSAVSDLADMEGTFYGFPDVNWSSESTIEEGVWLRAYLERKRRVLKDYARLRSIWRVNVINIFAGILQFVPDSATLSVSEGGDGGGSPSDAITVPLIDLCEKPAVLVERLIVTFFNDEVMLPRVFENIREIIDRNGYEASGIPYEDRFESRKQVIPPTEAKSASPAELVHGYLKGTPFATFFRTPLPFRIPFPVRFEHTHIVGGTGHGKTQLMQLLIFSDLVAAHRERRSVIVIDSQGDLINTISHLRCFDPSEPDSLADRLLIIDPNDIEYPVALNMFDWNRDRIGELKPVDREKILNGTIDLYEYLFGAVLGAELTARQGMIFKYLARLMLEIPDATIHTFREIMEDGNRFRPYMAKLPPTARAFFETRFFDRNFNETKKQILNRLWGILSNATFDRMFSHKRNKVDIYEAMNEGKIVLINTAKELLKQDGCSIFGRFFVALIAQAAIQRAVIPSHKRSPAFVYIDEAHDYFDDSIDQLLMQARKYRIGLVLAHQNLDQLSPSLRASLMTNTNTKFVGGASAKDARTFAEEMRSTPDFVHGMEKRKHQTDFACYVRNLTPQAIQVSVPIGYVDKLPFLEDSEYEENIASIRERYSEPPEDVWKQGPNESDDDRADIDDPTPPSPPTPVARKRPAPSEPAARATGAPAVAPSSISRDERLAQPSERAQSQQKADPTPTEPRTPGRGGRQHKYLQQVIKQTAEECGYLATIEESILGGTGWVDVSLRQGERRIACEIAVTSTQDQEFGNIEKCLAAGYDEVILVCPGERRRASLTKFITAQLEESVTSRVSFLLPDELIARLFDSVSTVEATESTIRGYKVKATQKRLSEEETRARREAIAKMLARSMGKGEK